MRTEEIYQEVVKLWHKFLRTLIFECIQNST